MMLVVRVLNGKTRGNTKDTLLIEKMALEYDHSGLRKLQSLCMT
jgi:hypothetical protein